jgi:transposase-like protein
MKPDKTKIGGWLKTALQLASEGSSFAKALEKIGPNITTVARWLGTEGAQLLKLTGLG